ncbi:fungal-specific transcription factor domain-containing protein [Mycena sp. CBHHK59/15]|nr:fungal-specific transcription factor domain-containing protein [Mycena sp. CBHHK59/15]
MGVSPKEKEQKTRKKPGRVPTSCAECRRLKLRCDRNVPCEKCVSRGCGSICPDGQLTSGKGNRLFLANTEELHDRIDYLCARIRDLEDALRTLQETVSDRPHSLLRDNLLQIKTTNRPAQDRSSTSSSSSQPSTSTLASDEIPDPLHGRSDEESIVDAFGTLTIGLHGETSFLGQTARSEYFFRALAKMEPPPPVVPPRLSRRIIAASFPESGVIDGEVGREVFELLPPLSEAIRLCETYLEHGKHLQVTLPRTELFDEILTSVYRSGSFETMHCHHGLSLLFIVFATAAILDPERHPYSIEAQEYYYLSRASLGLAPPVRETTLAAIQALIHMAQYLDLSDWEGVGSNAAWICMGTAVRLAHGIGLQLNSARWKLSEEASDRRSRLFWQLFSATLGSFSLGRPPSMSTAYIDCPYPKDANEVTAPDGSKEPSYFLWTCKYSVLMHSIMSTAFGSKVPPYASILDLDRRIRDFHIPLHLQPMCSAEMPTPTPTRQFQRFLTLSTKETTLLNLHRAYFAQALHDKPNDLASHRFIPSVMATYRSAWRLIRGLVLAWRNIPMLLSRVGSAWSPAISAAIVMCLLVTRAPTSKMTKSSLEELDSLSHLFAEAAQTCRFAANILEPILILTRRAHQAVDDNPLPLNTDCEVTPADLDRLGGKTHLISELNNVTADRDTPSPPQPQMRPSLFSDIAATSSETMHPTIAQDMRSFDLGEPSQFFDAFQDAAGMTGIQFSDNSIFSPQPGVPPFGYSPSPTFQSPSIGIAGAPPMLDATWQSFVEQLGF